MTTFERTTGPAGSVSVKIPFVVTDAGPLRDSVRSPFDPSLATVSFRDGRPSWVEINGFRLKKHHWTTGGFSVDITTGEVRPDRYNDEVPQWVSDMVHEASQHPAVRAFTVASVA